MDNWYKTALAEYWGSKASGCLFICKEDRTVLLFERSMDVEQGGTWGLTGGAIPNEFGMDEGYIESDFEDKEVLSNPEDDRFEDSARQETREETGTFPSEAEFIDSTTFIDGSFTFKTFIYNLSLEEKQSWTPTIQLNWENDDYQWFRMNELPENLHFGIENKLSVIQKSFEEEQTTPFVLAKKNFTNHN